MQKKVTVDEMFHGVQKNRLASRFALGPVSLQFVTIVLLALFSLLYLLQNNQMTTEGYKLAQVKNDQIDLLQEYEKYQVEASRLQALGAIQTKIGEMEMETVGTVEYFSID